MKGAVHPGTKPFVEAVRARGALCYLVTGLLVEQVVSGSVSEAPPHVEICRPESFILIKLQRCCCRFNNLDDKKFSEL